MKMQSSFKRILHAVGSGLALVGVAFVVFRIHTYWGTLDLERISFWAWFLVSVLVFIYASANIVLAMAWYQLIHGYGACLTRFHALKIYGVSQLAKYLPGNIFHLAGRQALGLAAGVPSVTLIKSTLAELLLIAFSGALYGVLTLPLLNVHFYFSLSVVLWFLIICCLTAFFRRLQGVFVARAFLLQTFFLAVSGGIFVSLLMAVSNQATPGFPELVLIGGAYVVAWLGGFLTPGAPAGVGVRELIILFLLKENVAEADLLLATLLGRLVTVAGDVLFFLASLVIRIKIQGVENE